MKVLITGGAGFIGSNLVALALARGYEVLNVDQLTYAGNPASLAGVKAHRNYRFERLDIGDGEAMREVMARFEPDGVLHLAAESHVDRSIDAPGTFIDTNITGTYTLLEAARHYLSLQPAKKAETFRFVQVSTDEVFGALGATGAFTETTRYAPRSPYSASKAAADHLVRAWHDTFGLPVIVTHSSNNYGPYQFPEKLIPLVILRALRGESIPVYGTGEQVRDWLHVGDHAEALLAVLERGKPGETYNIGANNERRNIDLVHLLCRLLDERQPRCDGLPHAEAIRFVADRPGHDFRYALDATKIRDELGWEPKQDHETGFRLTVEWYLENRPWWQAILDGSYRLERLGKAGCRDGFPDF